MTAELVLKIVIVALVFLVLREFVLVWVDRARERQQEKENRK